MSKTQKQTFLQGAIILVTANMIVKIIGAIFKIPLTYLIGPDGMGIYNTSYIIYTWLFVIATAGLPIAVSKMVSESVAKNNLDEAHKIFKVAFYLLAIVGMAGTAILFFGAKTFANMLGNSRAYLAMKAMSPSLLFVALMSSYRGYFQGMQNMVPTAISELAEALGKLLVGLLLAYLWLPRGTEYASAGAILGVSTGTCLGVLSLYFMYNFSRKKISKHKGSSTAKLSSARDILLQIFRIAIPITIGASVFSLTSVIDMTMIMNRLQSIGYSEVEASILYGYHSGYAVTMYNLPPTIVVAISISIVPALAGALAVQNFKKVRATTETALRVTTLFALPSAVGLSLLAGPILELIYNDRGAENILNILGIAVVFVSIVLVTNAILQASGRVMIPVRNMFIGGIVKIIVNYILVGNPQINIVGASVGTNLCYLVIVVLNLIDVKKVTGVHYKVIDLLVKPLISTASMAIAVLFVYNKLMVYTQSNNLATIMAILVGGVIYILMLLAIGGIKEADIEMMPKGHKLIKLLNRFGLLR